MKLSVYVNTDRDFDQDMLEALTRFEVIQCMYPNKFTTSEDVREFLKNEYGDELSSRFEPTMMLKAQDS